LLEAEQGLSVCAGLVQGLVVPHHAVHRMLLLATTDVGRLAAPAAVISLILSAAVAAA
jgi:hypothetical protein